MTNRDPAFNPETAVTVGRILAPHGTQGEVKVQPLTDFPERFDPRARLWLDGKPVSVKASRWTGKLVYLLLDGVNDRDKADELREQLLQVPQLHAIDAKDVYYQHDIVGLRVETTAGEALGKVESIFPTGANDVFVVQGERGELLLPAIDDVIQQVDIAGGRIVVELMPGLDFIKPASKTRHSRPQRPQQAGAAGYAITPGPAESEDKPPSLESTS